MLAKQYKAAGAATRTDGAEEVAKVPQEVDEAEVAHQVWQSPALRGAKATGERYLAGEGHQVSCPPREYAATTRKKRADTKKGKQHSKPAQDGWPRRQRGTVSNAYCITRRAARWTRSPCRATSRSERPAIAAKEVCGQGVRGRERENHPLRRQEHEDQEEPAGAAQVFPCETQADSKPPSKMSALLLVLQELVTTWL